MLKLLQIFVILSLNLCWILAAPQHINYKEVSEIPSDLLVCSEKDQNLSDCIKKAFQQQLQRAKNGIPEINIPPIDPLEVDKASYEFSNSVMQGKVAVRNLKIRGVSDSTVKSVDFKRNGDKIKLQIKAQTPKLLIDGKYKADFKINEVKMNSKGVFNLTMTDIDITALPEAELYERDGKKYLRMTKFDIDPTLGNFRFYATGLVPDAALNDALVETVNQNWRNVYKSLIPQTRSTWEPEVLKISNEYFSHIPFDLILKQD